LEINRDNLNSIRHEASNHFRNEKREHLKDKINELAMNSKNKNVRDWCEEYMNLKRVTNLEVI
jgi:hypothetical protein